MAAALVALLAAGLNLRPALRPASAPTPPPIVRPEGPHSLALLRSAAALAQERPAPVATETARFRWSGEDGLDTNVIRRLAHNELECERMLRENARIHRRQLVVFKETPAAVVERSRLTGEPVRQLTLPGLDGQEIVFEIARAEIEPSGLRGMFSGHVAGHPDSLVTLAYAQNRQAFTVLWPSAGVYLDAEAHEPGDAIVKGIDPTTYGVGPMANDGILK